jgi:tetratricopeptide (TPR) repeat protein
MKAISQTGSELFKSAMQYKAKENFTEVIRLLDIALGIEPANKEYKAEFANAQYQKRAFYHAIPLYEEMLKDQPENVEYLTRLSEMHSMSPKKMKGVEYADRALRLPINNGESYRILARSYQEVKHFPKAIKTYQMAEKMLPTDKDIPFKIATCYAQISDFKHADEYYTKAIQLDPGNAVKLYETATNCYENNDYKRALELYQQAEDNGYFRTSGFYDNWANACIELKDYNSALFYYSKAKEFAPYDREINLSIAEVYTKKGNFTKSRDILNELLDMNPNDAEVIYTYGMTFYKAGQTGKAESYFNKAFALDPSLRSLRYIKSSF